MIFVHEIDIWDLPESWVGHLWAWLLDCWAGLGRLVVQSVWIQWTKPIKYDVSWPRQVVSEVAHVKGLEHVLSEHQKRCTESFNGFIRDVSKSMSGKIAFNIFKTFTTGFKFSTFQVHQDSWITNTKRTYTGRVSI